MVPVASDLAAVRQSSYTGSVAAPHKYRENLAGVRLIQIDEGRSTTARSCRVLAGNIAADGSAFSDVLGCFSG